MKKKTANGKRKESPGRRPGEDRAGDGAGELKKEIARRRRAERKLQKCENALAREHAMFFKGPVVVFSWRNEEGWPVEYVSPNVKDVLGYSAPEWLSGKITYSEIIPKEELEIVAGEVRAFSESGVGSFHHKPYRLIRSDGSEIWVDDYTTILRDARGTITHYLGYIIDITERKRAESQREEAIQALRESEERYRGLIELSPNPIAVHCEGRLVFVNREGVRILGAKSSQEVIGRPVLDFVHPDYREAVKERVRFMMSTGQPAHLMEEKFLRIDGTPFDVEATAVSFRYNGKPSILVVMRDITERKRAEAEKLGLERQLLHTQKLESLGVLAGGVAHDFNNLLMAIMGNLELALMKIPPQSPGYSKIEAALRSSNRAADLTRQMLAYSGKGHYVVKEIDLSELVRENADMLKAAISKTVTLDLRLGRDLPPVYADTGQIQQIIMNLITNASEAIGERAGMVYISTSVEDCDGAYLEESLVEEKPAPGAFVRLEVSDTGCGMDESTLRRLFEPFFTTKLTGRGLGMSAVLGIVRGHKGAIFVESEPGRGTVVRVLFPVSSAVPGGTEKAGGQGEAPRAPREASVHSGSILIVDDEEMVRNVCGDMVEHFGFRTIMAGDGEEAIRIFRQRMDDIVCVILDLTMPRMDGLAAFDELRRIKPDVKVILSSGFNEQEATNRFTGQGLADFIQKPYQMNNLREKLDKLLK